MLGTFLRGARVIPQPTETITYIGSVSMQTASPTANFTFSSVDIGTAFANRRLVMIVGITNNSTTTGVISSVVVGSVTATNRVLTTPTGSNVIQVGIYDVEYPSDTSADIQVNMNDVVSGQNVSRILHVYAFDSGNTGIVTGTDSTSAFTFTRTFAAGEFYVGGGRAISTATETWTNATEDAATAESGRSRVSCASAKITSAGSSTITFTPSSTTSAFMASVVYTA